MSDEDQQTVRDFIYAGRRILSSGKIGHCVIPLDDASEHMSEKIYDLGAKYRAVIGGVYQGAAFGETKSYGIAIAKLDRVLHDLPERIDWLAEDRQVDIELAARRLASDAKRRNEIDDAMLPIRKRLHAARSRGDMATALAIRQAVMASLEKMPPSD